MKRKFTVRLPFDGDRAMVSLQIDDGIRLLDLEGFLIEEISRRFGVNYRFLKFMYYENTFGYLLNRNRNLFEYPEFETVLMIPVSSQISDIC